MKGGYFGPGQVAVFECAGLSFQAIDKVPASAGYVAKARPGRYTLRFRLRLPGDDVPFAAGERTWKGELETGPVTIEVKEPSAQSVAPVARWDTKLVHLCWNALGMSVNVCASTMPP